MLLSRTDAAPLRRIRVICALASALALAGMASADPTEVAEIASASWTGLAGVVPADPTKVAGSARADSTAVAGVPSADSTEIAAVDFADDAMPRGLSVEDRLAIIRERIQNALEYPPLARLFAADGDALVRFEIDHAGSAQNVHIVRSSGDAQLDSSALRAVETASPLPWVYGALEVPVHFELTEAR